MESAGKAACFFPWCQLNFATYRWAILGAITSFPSCLAAEYGLERDRFFFFFFFAFAQTGLWPLPVVADLCPGWGMKVFSVLYQSNSALPHGKQRSALGRREASYSFSIGTWLLLRILKGFKSQEVLCQSFPYIQNI